MFYICKKREDGTFGVMDTQDGVVEYYEPQDIIKFVKKLHVDIQGVYKKESGSWGISVLKPTNFQTVSTELLDSDGSEIKDFDSEYYRIRYEELSNYEITQLAKKTADNLCSVIEYLTGKHYYGESLDMLDGIDCLGFNKIDIPDSDYYISIYFNPDVQANLIYSKGFGFDLMMKLNNELITDGHFDSSFDEWKEDFKDYKYKNIFRHYFNMSEFK